MGAGETVDKEKTMVELQAKLKHAQEDFSAIKARRDQIAAVMTADSKRLDGARSAMAELSREAEFKGQVPHPGLLALLQHRIQDLAADVQRGQEALEALQGEFQSAARRYEFAKIQARISEILI
jgi:hypothetical protein